MPENDSSFKQFFTTHFPANISCFPRRLQDVFKTSSAQQFSSFKTSWRRLQDVFPIGLPKMSSRRLQDVFSVTLFVFQGLLKTSSRPLEDVFSTSSPRQMFAGLEQSMKCRSLRIKTNTDVTLEYSSNAAGMLHKT